MVDKKDDHQFGSTYSLVSGWRWVKLKKESQKAHNDEG